MSGDGSACCWPCQLTRLKGCKAMKSVSFKSSPARHFWNRGLETFARVHQASPFPKKCGRVLARARHALWRWAWAHEPDLRPGESGRVPQARSGLEPTAASGQNNNALRSALDLTVCPVCLSGRTPGSAGWRSPRWRGWLPTVSRNDGADDLAGGQAVSAPARRESLGCMEADGH